MGIKVKIRQFSHFSDGVKVAEVNGSTVGECLNHLVEQFPNLKLFDTDGELLAYLDVYVNGESAYPEGQKKPVKDRDELSIILMIGGG